MNRILIVISAVLAFMVLVLSMYFVYAAGELERERRQSTENKELIFPSSMSGMQRDAVVARLLREDKRRKKNKSMRETHRKIYIR